MQITLYILFHNKTVFKLLYLKKIIYITFYLSRKCVIISLLLYPTESIMLKNRIENTHDFKIFFKKKRWKFLQQKTGGIDLKQSLTRVTIYWNLALPYHPIFVFRAVPLSPNPELKTPGYQALKKNLHSVIIKRTWM